MPRYDWVADPDPRAVIYLCLDAQGSTLYVGQTCNWPGRRTAHHAADWWSSVATVLFLPAPGFDERMGAERALIQILDPPHNTQYTPRRQTDRQAKFRGLDWPQREAQGIQERRHRVAVRESNRRAYRTGCGPAEVGLPI